MLIKRGSTFGILAGWIQTQIKGVWFAFRKQSSSLNLVLERIEVELGKKIIESCEKLNYLSYETKINSFGIPYQKLWSKIQRYVQITIDPHLHQYQLWIVEGLEVELREK